jgi:hypothetical protein
MLLSFPMQTFPYAPQTIIVPHHIKMLNSLCSVPPPGQAGMERKDVMSKNVAIYKAQASALEKHAAPGCKVRAPRNKLPLLLLLHPLCPKGPWQWLRRSGRCRPLKAFHPRTFLSLNTPCDPPCFYSAHPPRLSPAS